MQNPQYTFLLPAYKVAFFKETLESIKNQTLKDYKVIVSDDCSPEDLKSVFDKVIGDDPRFEFRRNAVNLGGKSLVSHWNLLIDKCDTDFFIMAGDDDIYDSRFLETINNLVTKYNSVDLFRARVRTIDGNGDLIFNEKMSFEYLSSEDFLCRFYESDFISCVANYCFSTKAIKNLGGFIEFPLAWFSDEATIFALAKNGCCTTQETLFCFRTSDKNISSRWGDSNDCKLKMLATLGFNSWMKDFLEHFSNTGRLEHIRRGYKTKVYTNILNHIVHCDFLSFLIFLLKSPNDIGLKKVRLFAHYLNNKLHQG